MVFVKKISKIIQVVTNFIDSISAIAAGAIGAAAKKVEDILARPAVTGDQLPRRLHRPGQGRQTRSRAIIEKIRGTVDKAIDWLIDWIVTMAKTLFSKVFGKDKAKPDTRTDAQKLADLNAGVGAAEGLMKADGATPDGVKSKLGPIKNQYRLTVLELRSDGETEFHVHGEVNPPKDGSKYNLEGERYNVQPHVAERPSGTKRKGESHHVPVKVMKMWFSETLQKAAKLADDDDLKKALRNQAKDLASDPEGKGLSAIWLSEKDHVTVHGAKPDFPVVIVTSTGTPATRPTRRTFERSVPDPIVVKRNNPDTGALERTFRSVFNSMLEVGLSAVAVLGFKGPWRSKLSSMARVTWSNFLKVPKK